MNYKLAVIFSAVLAGCGGGGGGGTTGGGGSVPDVLVANADTTLAANASTTGAVVNTPFSFPTGVSELGTSAETSVAFTSTATSPAFAISSGGNTATGITNFGSCIFVVTNSSFPAGHRLANGQTVTINPCNIRLGTQGAPADSVARQRAAVFILGASASTSSSVTVVINPGGTVTINGQAAGTVTLSPVTG